MGNSLGTVGQHCEHVNIITHSEFGRYLNTTFCSSHLVSKLELCARVQSGGGTNAPPPPNQVIHHQKSTYKIHLNVRQNGNMYFKDNDLKKYELYLNSSKF